ncbi:MAG TPA: hypothetical protein VF432_29900 [Thermoanaerobaculia bacterium]
MKRLILILIVVFAAGSLLAGEGKSCDASKAKSVKLTGTLAAGDGGTKVFRVADSNKSYTICHKTSSDVAKLGANGATLQVTGKIVACDEAEGEELVIETAKKI